MESSSFRSGLQTYVVNPERETRNSVFIISDSGLIRETLAASLQQRLKSIHIHSLSSFTEAVTRLDIARPGTALIDATMRDSLSATKWLRLRDPAARLIALNVNDAHDVVAWTKIGIIACVHRSASLEEIIEQIVIEETTTNGSAVTSLPGNTQDASSPFGGITDSEAHTLTIQEEVISRLIARGGESDIVIATTSETITNSSAVRLFPGNTHDKWGSGATNSQAAILTAREDEVARLIIAGESNKDIARLLNISVPTVKSHVHNLLIKLGLQRRGRLALRYNGVRVSQLTDPSE
jgi:DNA-binding NarL/FixJ family response regulator